jgi:L-alanine-DL-glutamate epimerase-like enolase superfamily enzyme
MLRARARGGIVVMTAISGVGRALWDIKGRRGTPVYILLAAVPDKLLMTRISRVFP